MGDQSSPLVGNSDETASTQTGNFPYTSPVGSFAANGYGLVDMMGNVEEWNWDRYGTYPASGGADYTGPATGLRRIVRGGSWNDNAKNGRVAARANTTDSFAANRLGFRLVRSAF